MKQKSARQSTGEESFFFLCVLIEGDDEDEFSNVN
jgi:hypothetical protein